MKCFEHMKLYFRGWKYFHLIFDSHTLNHFGCFFFRKMEVRNFVMCVFFLFCKDLHPSTQTYRTSRTIAITYELWQQLETN